MFAPARAIQERFDETAAILDSSYKEGESVVRARAKEDEAGRRVDVWAVKVNVKKKIEDDSGEVEGKLQLVES